MRRREFITLSGRCSGQHGRWPRVQEPAAMPVIGILSGGSSNSFTPLETSFRKGLAEVGFVDGKISAFEYRTAQGQFDRLPGLAVDLVSRGPGVIATVTLPAALAAKAATTAIPVVFVIGEDPVKAGLVTSLNRPDANVTGISNFMNLLGAKRLELVSEVVPKAVDLALLVNPKNPNAEADTADLRAAADALRPTAACADGEQRRRDRNSLRRRRPTRRRSLVRRYRSLPFRPPRAACHCGGAHGLPTIYPLRDYVVAGGLMSYGASFAECVAPSRRLYRSGFSKVPKASRFAGAAVRRSSNLVINLKTAKALGLDVPPSVLALADEVIE